MEISVLMGVYSRSKDTTLLIRAVKSILKQTFKDMELLICDDGSCDEVSACLDAAAERDERIRLLREGKKYSLSEKLNYCLQFARGRYIARMDDDDYSLPDRFEKQIVFLRENNEIGFVGSNVLLVERGKPAGKRMLPEYPSVSDFLFVQPFVHPALMFRRESFIAVNGYSENKRQNLCEDYDLLLRMYEKGICGYNLQEYLLEYTIWPSDSKKRKFHHRVNEAVTRWNRFKALGLLPKALPYVIKPVIVGMLPQKLVSRLKKDESTPKCRRRTRN